MKKQLHHSFNSSGQALIMLLFFFVVAIIIISAAVIIIFTNSLGVTKSEQGQKALSIAESGVENALLQLLRNPFYTGENTSVDEGIMSIVVTGADPDPRIIFSTGKVGSFVRRIKATVQYNGDVMTIVSWKEL